MFCVRQTTATSELRAGLLEEVIQGFFWVTKS